jgi:hypothetical protein
MSTRRPEPVGVDRSLALVPRLAPRGLRVGGCDRSDDAKSERLVLAEAVAGPRWVWRVAFLGPFKGAGGQGVLLSRAIFHEGVNENNE